MPGAAGRGLTVLAGALALASTATTALDWGRSGQRVRTSYEVVDVADRAGVLPDGTAWIAPLWHLVPAMCGLALVALVTGRRLVAGAVTATLGALVGTGAILVDRSPLVAEPAVAAAVGLGAATALCGVVVLVTARKETAG